MNRTLLSAILVTALTAMNCFAAETWQTPATAAGPGASLPVASQALANPAPASQQALQPRGVGGATFGKVEKSSPIVEVDSQHDAIAPQKSQFDEAALTKQTPQMQTVSASAGEADTPSASGSKKTFNAPKMKVLSQTTPTTGSTRLRTLGTSTGPAKTPGGGCQSCNKKKTLTSGDNTTATETTK